MIYFFHLHTTIRLNYRVLFHLFYSFFSARPFDQKLGSSLIYFFRLHTTIRQKYLTFFLSFIHSLCTTIRPKNRVLINLLFLFVHDHSTKLGVTLTLLFIFFLDVPMFRLLYSRQVHCMYTIFIGELFLYFVRFIHGYMKSLPGSQHNCVERLVRPAFPNYVCICNMQSVEKCFCSCFFRRFVSFRFGHN